MAATIGANQASGYQLATDASVMPIGGFNGSDPSPTLAQFQQLVADGRIHYFISGGFGGGGPGGGSSGTASQITSWVTQQLHLDDRGRGHPVRPHRPGLGLAGRLGLCGSGPVR